MSREDEGSIRAFLAIRTPDSAQDSIRGLSDKLAPVLTGARIVPAEKVHLTLHFFGTLKGDEADIVKAAMDEVAGDVAPFRMELSGAGVFPDRRRPRVLWLGLGPGREDVVRIAGSLGARMRKKGLEVDARPFEPHVTIARFGRAGSRCPAGVFEMIDDHPHAGWLADRVTLFRSELTRAGPVYSVLREAALAGPVEP